MTMIRTANEINDQKTTFRLRAGELRDRVLARYLSTLRVLGCACTGAQRDLTAAVSRGRPVSGVGGRAYDVMGET